MLECLAKNILSTVVYCDILDYPLTSFEIWKYLISQNAKFETCNERNTLSDVIKTLDSEEIKKHIEEFRGFYFLKGRKELVQSRIEKNKISEKKFKLIRKIASWLKYAPYVRMIAVTGKVAMKNADAKSDLDFFISLKHGRIFTGRFFVTLVSQLLAKRRHGRKISDRACLNYYVTDKNPNIDTKDLFSSSEYSFIFPVYNFPAFRKFQESNFWIKNYRPNFEPDTIPNLKMVRDNFFSRSIRKIFELILDFDFLEKIMKKWQMGRITKDPRTHKPGSAVSASDENLIFLPEPQGPEVFEKYQARMEKITPTSA